jgi:hypothetical protein
MKMQLQLLVTAAFMLLLMSTANAQLQAPAASPNAKVTYNVGLSEVHIDYNRPSMKDRVVFGDLVPYGEGWRTGANASTKITFSDDVTIMGKELAAGTYSLFSVPNEGNWEIMFHSNLRHNTPGGRDAEEDALVIKVSPKRMDFTMETFTITVNNLRNSSAEILLMWENTAVAIPFEVDTDTKVMANIESVLAGPTGRDYFVAASYYYEEGKDLNQALKWMNKSIELDGDRFWVLRTKALIQKELRQYDAAIKTLEKSSKLAEEWGNAGYPRMNAETIAEIKAMR